MAKPYREGKTWSFRFRPCGEDIYCPGYATSAAAKKAFEEMVAERKGKPRPAHMGPEKTSLAVALSDYGQERFPFMKGAAQEARRVNKFLRDLGLPTLVVTKATERGEVKSAMRPEAEDKRLRYHDVQLKATPPAIPQSLVSHRAALKEESVASDAKRRLLARTPMAEVTTYQVQRFVDALKDDGFGAASIHLEIAVIRQVFKHARQVWSWSRPAANPCTGLNLPSVDNKRERIMTEMEWADIARELARSENPYVLPLAALMVETAMRSCEPLMHADWQNVEWKKHVLRLPDGKSGKRDVPLGPGAIAVLQYLAARTKVDEPHGPIFPTTYEAFKKAWSVACKAAGVRNLRPHDLRHTSATRYALELHGNIPVLKVITGHKTLEMVARYVNISAEQVAAMQHGEALSAESTPAGFNGSGIQTLSQALDFGADELRKKRALQSERQRNARAKQALERQQAAAQAMFVEAKVIQVDFTRRAA